MKYIVTPAAAAASTTSGSRIEPPGATTARTPASSRTWRPSANGKNASEATTEPVVIANLDAGGIALAILDGEAVPAGGLGIAKQLKDEIYQCPPVLVLTGRPQDAWLATWSRAEAAVPQPIDPIQLADAVVSLLRSRVPVPDGAGH